MKEDFRSLSKIMVIALTMYVDQYDLLASSSSSFSSVSLSLISNGIVRRQGA